MLISKPKKNVCSSKEQSSIVLTAQEHFVDQCVMYEKKMKQASRSAKAMLFLWMLRTINLLCVLTRTVKMPSLFNETIYLQEVS